MSPGGRVEQMLEEILSSGRTPEEVASDAPELLEEVRQRWNHLRRIEAQLDTLFPPSDEVPGDAAPLSEERVALAEIPGYDVTGVLGRGGMGIVYRGIHAKLQRAVAIKMVLASRYATPREAAALSREAQAIAAMRHCNIVQVYDVGEVDGCPYFTMEYMDGGTLAQKIAAAPMPASDAAKMIVTLAGAVEAAHQHGIVHRDLKPANVLLTADGTPKISDFGLAHQSEGDHQFSLMQTGVRIGTPSYMAPEQALGQRDSVGPTTDVYALGAILYEMLTGRPPFLAQSADATLRQVIDEDPAAPSRLNAQVPRDLETICLKCLEKEPRKRYPSAQALAEDVGRFVRGEPITARPVSRVERVGKWVRRHPARTTAVVACVVALLVSLVAAGRILGSRAQITRDVRSDLAAVARHDRAGNWTQAREALERARGRLGQQGFPELREELAGAERDLQLVSTLNSIRLTHARIVGRRLEKSQAAQEYQAALSAAGLDLASRPPSLLAQQIAASPIRDALLAALDDWAVCVNGFPQQVQIFEIARGADPAPKWRDKVRDAAVSKDALALKKLSDEAALADEPVAILVALSDRISDAKGDPTAFCRRVQRAYPGDFWANFNLAYALHHRNDAEAITYYQAALALRPGAIAVLINLANTLEFHGRRDEALEYERLAVRADPASALAHHNLGFALCRQGKFDEALVECSKAVELDPSYAQPHHVLSYTLKNQGRFADSKAEADKFLALLPRDDPQYSFAQEMAKQAAALLEMDAHLPDVLAGTEQPPPLLRRSYGTFCLLKRQYADAVRLFEEAFAAEPPLEADLGGDARLQAACAAVGAAEAVQDPAERARLLEKALKWLHADVSAWSALLDKRKESDRLWLLSKVSAWKSDPHLAAIRDDDAMRVWSPDQQERCRALWRDVEALLSRAAASAP